MIMMMAMMMIVMMKSCMITEIMQYHNVLRIHRRTDEMVEGGKLDSMSGSDSPGYDNILGR